MTRDDHELGTVRRCPSCRGWWPDDNEFYYYSRGVLQRRKCRACTIERLNARRKKRARDNERKRELREDPVLGEKLRARQREAMRRYYYRNREAVLERHRERYAAKLDRPVREGFGRPRVGA